MALIVVLQNMSNLTPISDYKAEVYVNDLPIWRGEVKEHKREEGWTVLVKKLVQVASKDTTQAKMTKLDGAQARCLQKLQQLKKEGKLNKFTENRTARLKRNTPDKLDAWLQSYGVSQAVFRGKI
jgi:hypothetical protein